MEFLYIVGFYVGIWLIYKIVSGIVHIFEKHREKIRDQAATELFNELKINPDELIAEYQTKLKNINYDRDELTRNYINRFFNKKRRYSELQGKCPECKEGYLTLRKGQYGKFLGCSRYPKCKYTLNIKKAQEQYKKDIMTEFMEDLTRAYTL